MRRSALVGIGLACLAMLIAVDTAQAQLLRGRRAANSGSGVQQGQYAQPYADGSVVQGTYVLPSGQIVSGPIMAGQMMATQPLQMQMMQQAGYTQLGSGMYTSLAGMQAQNSDQVVVRVLVPTPGARVSLQGQEMQQQPGIERSFISPPLQRGANYVYTIRATWTENGQQMSQERRIPVTAGTQVTVNLMDRADQQQQQQQQQDRSRQQLQGQQSGQQQQADQPGRAPQGAATRQNQQDN